MISKNLPAIVVALSFFALAAFAVEPAKFRLMLGHHKIIDQNDIQTVTDALNPEANHWEITLTLNPKGTERLAKATTANIGKKIKIIVDGKVISAPDVMMPIDSGKVAFSVHTKENADALVARIQSAIPASKNP
jgi:preprotein translocase subunit SecD